MSDGSRAAGDPATAAASVDDAVADAIGEEHLVSTASALVGIDTRNPPGDTTAAVEYVEDYLSDLGVTTRRVATDPAKPNLLAHLPGAGDATLLLAGHLDTVPFDPAEWSRDPLGEVVGDRLYGRGATDMKGSVAAMLATVRAYAGADVAPATDVALALVSDEETAGEAGLPALLSADALSADACVIGEPTCERGRHSVTVADRGSIWLTLEARGSAAHGSRPAVGVNAVERLWAAVEDVEAALADRSLRLDPGMAPIVEESVAFYADSMGEAAARATFERPTVNVGRFSGGEAVNTVPERATAELDVRVSASVHTPDVVDEIRAIVAEHEGVEVADVSWSLGSYEPPDSPVVDATVAAAESVCGERVYRRSATGGGDAKTLRAAGIPTVEFAFGVDNAHAVDEYTTSEALRWNAETYARLPAALASVLDDSGR